LDAAHGGSAYRAALCAAVIATDKLAALPSTHVLSEMEQRYDNSYGRFALEYSSRHRGALQRDPLPDEVGARFARMARESIGKQRQIEERDKVPFETYRRHYLSHESLRAG